MKSGEWIAAGKLKKGMKLLNANDEMVTVKDELVEEQKVTVYNFEVKDWHNYFVGRKRVLVHNSCVLDNWHPSERSIQLGHKFSMIFSSVAMIISGYPSLISGGISGLSAILAGGDEKDWIAATVTGAGLGWTGKVLIAAGISKDYIMLLMAEANYSRTYALARLAGQNNAEATWIAFSTAPLGMTLNRTNLEYNYRPSMQMFFGTVNAGYQQFNIQK